MTNKNIIRILNIIAVIAATVGGASTVPDLNLPKAVLAYGLFLAMVCKAVTAELQQVKGESDEVQGITPDQVKGVSAVRAAAQSGLTPVVVATTPNPIPGPAASATVVKVLAFGLLLLGVWGCASAIKDAAAINGAAVSQVGQSMHGWANYTQTHTVSSGSILAVSNAYNAYWNTEVVASNTLKAYVANPSTNAAATIADLLAGVSASSSNVVNLVNQFAK